MLLLFSYKNLKETLKIQGSEIDFLLYRTLDSLMKELYLRNQRFIAYMLKI